MKKSLLFVLAFAGTIMFSYGQLDTVIAFTFPVNSGLDSLNANYGISVNLGYDIRFETESTASTDSITLTNGVYSSSGTDYAATADDWHNGANDKYWSVKFKTTNYTNLVLYSKQRSGGATPGPKYFKVQYRIGSTGTWADVSADTVTVANDWTTGVVDGWAIPSDAWNASQSVYIRWISVSDISSTGATVDSTGISKIDEIFVLGTNAVGITENVGFCKSIYPNPANDVVNIVSNEPVAIVYIMTMDGRVVSTISNPGSQLNISGLANGNYMLRFVSESNTTQRIHNIIVE